MIQTAHVHAAGVLPLRHAAPAVLPRPQRVGASLTLQRRLSHFGASSTGRESHRESRHVEAAASSGVVTEPWWERHPAPNMKHINSVQEFVNEMASAGDRLVVVSFYAKWCNACRALGPKLSQLCNENPDIVMLKVDFDENRDVVKPLAIKVLPYFHFYRGSEGRVAAFSASVSKIQRLKDALAEHNTPRCSMGPAAPMAEFATGNNVVARHPTPERQREPIGV